jgi:nucleoside-diphosphate-sugar epimerase
VVLVVACAFVVTRGVAWRRTLGPHALLGQSGGRRSVRRQRVPAAAITGLDLARELRLRAARVPGKPVAAVARAVAKLPYVPSGAQGVEAISHPAIMNTTKAKTQPGWRPRHTAIEALRSTLN